jgi:hypothetical protein
VNFSSNSRLFFKIGDKIVDLGDFFNKKGDIFWTFLEGKKSGRKKCRGNY